jgi:hypothetical protein
LHKKSKKIKKSKDQDEKKIKRPDNRRKGILINENL